MLKHFEFLVSITLQFGKFIFKFPTAELCIGVCLFIIYLASIFILSMSFSASASA
jgi:hypothetical protein